MDFPIEKQQQILLRICEGPPRSWFRQGTEIDTHVDRSRYDFLSDMVDDGFDIGPPSAESFGRHPRALAAMEAEGQRSKQGFTFGMKVAFASSAANTDKLKDVTDGELVAKAREIAATAGFMEGDSWQDFALMIRTARYAAWTPPR